MDLNEYKNIWVFMEHDDGKVKNVGLELINESKKMAEACGYEVWAVAIGSGLDDLIAESAAYGADKVLVVEDERYKHYNTDAYSAVMEELIGKYKPSVIMIGATINGRDLGPKVAGCLQTGLTADCTELEMSEEGLVTWIRPALGGNLMGHINCPNTRPQMGTVRPAVFKKAERQDGREVEVLREEIHIPDEKIRMRTIDVVKHDLGDKIKIEEANIVVAGGRGMAKEENFKLLQDLADAMGGVVAGSRKAVDAGWITVDNQVGQTGKTVSPDIYVAVGISGAIQHQVGMNGADVIIAINSDKDAPIFDIATYGIVGDLFEVVPALTEAMNTYRKEYAGAQPGAK
ncbi:MAG: electron transfer flavoprotein subunit alpha/FixB family protein [Clostridiales bacterium]|nr:electron transfer flavoprotein subunit alpha/FixB family protein [Clostridiales bacterium]